jgi:hypothetical protein
MLSAKMRRDKSELIFIFLALKENQAKVLSLPPLMFFPCP